MENQTTKWIVIGLVIGLIVGLGGGYLAAPTKTETITETITVEVNPLDGKTIQLGDITPVTARLEYETPFYTDVIESLINSYATKLGYDVAFEILIDDAEGSSNVHLEKVQGFKANDVNLMVGGVFSSMSQAAIPYLNENNMLMISPGASSPLLSIANDRYYRTGMTDGYRSIVSLDLMESWGIKALIAIHTADAFGDGLYNIIEQEWPSNGKVILGRARMASDVTEFSTYLQLVSDLIEDTIASGDYDESEIGVFAVSTAKLPVLLSQALDYETLSKVIWFGGGSSGRDQRTIDAAPEAALQFRVFSGLQNPPASEKWAFFEEEFTKVSGLAAGHQDGATADGLWLLALSVLETTSTDAADIVEILPDMGEHYYGYTGWCPFDEFGDRKPGLFTIWGYYEKPDGSVGFTEYASYDYEARNMQWNEELLAEQGLTKPGP
jgi:ABC-type branched-subunit amino acid transport system substrate-binding protein